MVDDGSGLHGVMDNIDVWTGEDGDDTKSNEEEVDKERKVHPSPYIQHSSPQHEFQSRRMALAMPKPDITSHRPLSYLLSAPADLPCL